MSTRVYFNGTSIAIPGAYSVIDTSGMFTKYDGNEVKVLAILGESEGGEPNALNFIDDPTVGRKLLKGGELLKACEKAWNPVSKSKPSVALGGASRICAIRTNQATKSVLDTPNLKFQSKDWGKNTQYFVSISDGELSQTKALMVYDPVRDVYENYNNLGNLFTIKYEGPADSAVISIKKQEDDELHLTTELGYMVTTPAVEGSKAVGKIKFDVNSMTASSDGTGDLSSDEFAVGSTVTVEVPDGDSTKELNFIVTDVNGINIEETEFSDSSNPKTVFEFDIQSEDYGVAYNLTDVVVKSITKPTKYDTDGSIIASFSPELISDIETNKVLAFNSVTVTTDNGVDEIPEVSEMNYTKDLDMVLNKANYRNFKKLADDIASYEGYTVSAKNNFNTNLQVTDIDLIYGQVELKDTTYRLTAICADIHNTLDRLSEMIEVTTEYEQIPIVENIDYSQLQGGTEGTSPNSWLQFFEALSNFDISYIVPLTDDESIHAELQAHCNEMSGVIGRERRGIVGGHTQETVAQTVARARMFSDARMQVVHGGFYDYNQDSEVELYPPYMLAAAHGGRACRLEDGEPATHDVYRMLAPEYKLTRTEINELLDAGALAFEYVLGSTASETPYTRLVQDLTTDTLNKDSVHTERATGALADSILKEVRRDLDELLTGKRTAASDMESAKNHVVSILTNRLRKNQIVAFKNVKLTKVGTVTYVYFDIAPAEPNNFTLITAYFYSETLTSSNNGLSQL